MTPPPRNARLLAAVDRTSHRLAEVDPVLHAAAETRALAWRALARSRRLLAQVERSQAGERLAETPGPWPSAPTGEGQHDQDLSH